MAINVTPAISALKLYQLSRAYCRPAALRLI